MHLDKIRQNLLLKSVQNVCKVIIVFGTNRGSISRQALVIAMFVCADYHTGSWHKPVLTLKVPNKIAADDILIFDFYLSKKIRLDFSCESSA